ncbi:helix-turn-helix transcriptional regulator [Candidatus Amarobacter glycogenicus]|uniref:helix-turn-helix domain-containing protein n=1 Tax=Candidatus Amarobacter glycogenicus TaxID=3140699 RepID=UPI0031CCB90B
MAFSATVRERRQSLGLSREQLADLCGLHRTYVSSLERTSERRTGEHRARLAGALQNTNLPSCSRKSTRSSGWRHDHIGDAGASSVAAGDSGASTSA